MHDQAAGALSYAQEERAAPWYKPNRTYRVVLNSREVELIARGAFKPSVPELSDKIPFSAYTTLVTILLTIAVVSWCDTHPDLLSVLAGKCLHE